MTEGDRAQLAKMLPVIVTVEGAPAQLPQYGPRVLAGGHIGHNRGGLTSMARSSRSVAKGQHGFTIWVPKFATEQGKPAPALKGTEIATVSAQDEEISGLDGFLTATVFDVTQTVEFNDEKALSAGGQ